MKQENKTLRSKGIADINEYGIKVLGDKFLFAKWLYSHNKALGDKIPAKLLNTYSGRQEVRTILGRIEHGVYS